MKFEHHEEHSNKKGNLPFRDLQINSPLRRTQSKQPHYGWWLCEAQCMTPTSARAATNPTAPPTKAIFNKVKSIARRSSCSGEYCTCTYRFTYQQIRAAAVDERARVSPFQDYMLAPQRLCLHQLVPPYCLDLLGARPSWSCY